MDKTYKPETIEAKCYADWEQHNYFAPSGVGDPYCIMLPPPNVTGSLHMGHAFQQTLMDILIRYHRMQGDDTLWQCGTDHAGIATQMVVERQLQQKNISRHDLGREKFIAAVWDWKEHSGNTITQQSRRLGASMDWSRERFTMDDGLSAAVKEVFVRLYDEGLIYRGKRLVNWDPVLHTAISDLEVIATEEAGHLWHMRYPLSTPVDGREYIIVATTRPETMLGDAAIAVHPDDERYQSLVGQAVRLPLTERTLPIIADDYVDPEFGTGCVKITPAHDFNDYDVGERHKLEKINIFTVDATLNDAAPAKYRGLGRYAARRQIVTDLEALGFIEKIDDHKLMVPRGDRSQAVIEPYLTDQWYVKIQPLADPAIKAVREGAIKFVPANWDKTFFEWMHNIQDWCISRQLWWGHRIPAWYDTAGNIYVGHDEAAVRAKYNLGNIELKQDEDVLDTWFSSALWPFSTLGWPNKTPALDKFYPTHVLVTGFDIIFFWVARMIMMGLKFMGDVPFKEVYIHGLVRDGEGQKMSKSKGNVLDPIDLIAGIQLEALIHKRTSGLMQPKEATKIAIVTRKHFPHGIEAYGTDALRFTFATLATQGRFINFETGRIQGHRNFCNKLWNATAFVMQNVATQALDMTQGEKILGLAECWITTKLATVIAATHEGIRTYRFDLATQALYEFTWDTYCAWYIELSKTTLNSETASVAEKRGTLYTLLNVLETLQRALHPFMPFITETLWQRVAPLLGKQGKSIMLESFPHQATFAQNQHAVEQIEWIKSFIMAVRRIRSERDISPGKKLSVFVQHGTSDESQWLAAQQAYIKTLGGIESIKIAENKMDDAVMALAGEMTLFVPLADIMDPKAEKKRLERAIEKLQNAQSGLEKKLNNPYFVERAPVDVVDSAKQRLVETRNEIYTYEKQLHAIAKLLKNNV